MTTDDDAQHGDRQPATTPSRRRLAIGGAGLAAVLGGGAFLLTTQASDDQGTAAAPDTGIIQQVTPTAASSAEPSGSRSASAPASASATPDDTVEPSRSKTATRYTAPATPSPTRSQNSAAVRREIDRARADAAKDGHPVQRPLRQQAAAVAGGDISTVTQQTDEGTIRISTAKGDLSGQDDQLLAADEGKPVGNARCTQNVHFSADAPARKVPTLLLCWRTSASRSVVTLAVAKKGTPSSAASAATIDREWAKLS